MIKNGKGSTSGRSEIAKDEDRGKGRIFPLEFKCVLFYCERKEQTALEKEKCKSSIQGEAREKIN